MQNSKFRYQVLGTSGLKSQAPTALAENFKHQVPNPKQAPISKSKIQNNWFWILNLDIRICLEFRNSDLGF